MKNVIRTTLALLLVAIAMLAQQNGAPVSVVEYPHDQPTTFSYYDANGNLTHVCYARPLGSNSTDSRYALSVSVSASTLTSIVDSANTATVTFVADHGLRPGSAITISGATMDTDLNGTYYVQTVPSSTTLTVTTSGVTDATYNESTLAASAFAPRLTSAIWSIRHYVYDSNGNLTDKQWANGNAGSYTNICANATTTTGATRIYYK